MPWDKAPIDLSHLLDAPAGQHGFLGVKGDRFVFEDGTEFRFWGVTMSGSACFPSHSEAPKIAERLARFGINVVRFKNWDAPWVEFPLFQLNNNAPSTFNPQSIGRLDYFIFQLANRGIYTYMDGLGARTISSDSQLRLRENIEPGFKGAIHYAPEVQAIHQGDLTAFWTHHNKYLQREYRDSPAIIMTQLFHNNGLSAQQIPSLGFQKEFHEKWKEWRSHEELKNRPFQAKEPKSEEHRFLAQVLEQSHIDTAYHLRRLGVKCPIGGNNPTEGKDLASLLAMDFTASEGILNPPIGNFQRYFDRSMLNNPPHKRANLFTRFAFARIKNKPYVVSEWGNPWPNQHRAELPLWMAAMACFQDWNGCISSPYRRKHDKAIQHLFAPLELFNDPCLMGLFPAAALMFHRQDLEPSQTKITLNMPEEDMFSPNQWTAEELKPTRFIHRALIEVEIQSNASGSRIFQASEPETWEHASERFEPSNRFYHDYERGLVAINTPRTQALIGNINQARTNELDSVKVISQEPFGVICVSSFNKQPIDETDDLLITVISKAQNHGFQSRQEGNSKRIMQTGYPPIQIKETPARVFLKNQHKQWKIQPITPSGELKKPLPYQRMNNELSFEIGTRGAMYYRLQKQIK